MGNPGIYRAIPSVPITPAEGSQCEAVLPKPTAAFTSADSFPYHPRAGPGVSERDYPPPGISINNSVGCVGSIVLYCMGLYRSKPQYNQLFKIREPFSCLSDGPPVCLGDNPPPAAVVVAIPGFPSNPAKKGNVKIEIEIESQSTFVPCPLCLVSSRPVCRCRCQRRPRLRQHIPTHRCCELGTYLSCSC